MKEILDQRILSVEEDFGGAYNPQNAAANKSKKARGSAVMPYGGGGK